MEAAIDGIRMNYAVEPSIAGSTLVVMPTVAHMLCAENHAPQACVGISGEAGDLNRSGACQ